MTRCIPVFKTNDEDTQTRAGSAASRLGKCKNVITHQKEACTAELRPLHGTRGTPRAGSKLAAKSGDFSVNMPTQASGQAAQQRQQQSGRPGHAPHVTAQQEA